MSNDLNTDKFRRDTKNIWFPNQKEPFSDDPFFKLYWARERSRCINGFYIANGQVYIPGLLYWHTVYWNIELDIKKYNPVLKRETSFKGPGVPKFRDIEWEVFNELYQCEIQQKHYCLVGSRGFGKSMISSSFEAHGYTFFDDIEILSTGGNHPDIAKLNEKIEFGLSRLHPAFYKQRIKNNWKVEVRAGWIDRATGLTRGSNSRIISRNYSDGNDTMATNGTRPKRQVIDEIGKIPNLKNCIFDSVPSWMNDTGLFCTAIFTGTGGDMEVGKDAGEIFNDPKTYSILEFTNPTNGLKIGKFMPVTKARNEYKTEWTLYDYLKNKFPETYSDLVYHKDLDVKILVSDEERCMKEFVEPRREQALKAADSNAIIKEKAYYPITPEECFLTISANDYPVEAAKQHEIFLQQSGFKARRVELFQNMDGSIGFKDSERLPVTDFPIKPTSDKRGVVEIVEFPPENPKLYDFVAGIDPYKTSESEYSDSVGSVFIWKRRTTDMSEPFQDMPVAWYHGRPKDIAEWQENVRLLLKLYNASAMCESNDENFITYMMERNEEHYLARGQSYLKEINPNSKFKGAYGLPATISTITHWNNASVRWTKELVSKENVDNSKLVKQDEETKKKYLLGISRVLDPMTLKEIIAFNKKEGNFDRQRALSIACAYAKQLDSNIGYTEIDNINQSEKRQIYNGSSMYYAMAGKSKISNSGFKKQLTSSPFSMKGFNRN